MTDSSAWKAARPFVLGGASGMMATCVIQPIDMIKVQKQLAEGAVPSTGKVVKDIMAKDGVAGFYRGLSAGIFRQATYTTARMGLFNEFQKIAKQGQAPGEKIPIWKTFLCGMSAGALGAVVGNPADLSLIRMQADSSLPEAQRRNYKGVFDALFRIAKEEGIMGWFSGCAPTVVRAAVLNTGMFVSQDVAKNQLSAALGKPKNDLYYVEAPASMIAGFFAAACSLPLDMIKTRIQKMKPDAEGKLPYSGNIDCAMKILKQEGPLGFYKGFGTFLIRIGPHVSLTLVTLDFLKKTLP
ncbi:hypothetical protein CYMTET_39874 [Cymbomonas tetramitiformis]|uniref:Uncharacterized protein n=1 Tax=Cymbomonas tetramitiformis TaxID=36881 RepID=A0AAE0F3J5_9CHLO|nr:hypothetical protein CYMTET_39874 [Cymbomonas tetramitiformis]|eukprot:gene11008-13021_t